MYTAQYVRVHVRSIGSIRCWKRDMACQTEDQVKSFVSQLTKVDEAQEVLGQDRARKRRNGCTHINLLNDS